MRDLLEGAMKSATQILFVLFVFVLLAIPTFGQTERLIYKFSTTIGNPFSGIVIVKGSAYGTANGVYELSTKKQEVIYDCESSASLIADSAGNLYGLTGPNTESRCSSIGTVFELSQSKTGWTETTLHAFTGGADGRPGSLEDQGSLIMDASGNLYGTTYAGGLSGCGVVFELSPNGDGTWRESVLYAFTGLNGDGSNPVASVTLDTAGNLYGTTLYGGIYGFGTVFELTPSSAGWTETVLHSFENLDPSNGALPIAGLVIDSEGNLYGTTWEGGANSGDWGTVYEVSPPNWDFTLLHSFEGTPSDGALPGASLTFDAQGNLWGTTFSGGRQDSQHEECSSYDWGCGTVFELKPLAGNWEYSVVHFFAGAYTDGADPFGGIVFDSKGNAWGTTANGGHEYYPNMFTGTLYEIIP
jgi:uncharacterized repeat protein (TIGR03803 family)